MPSKKVEACPLTGKECDKEKCSGPFVFESRNPAFLAIREIVVMCTSVDMIRNDSYVQEIKRQVEDMHTRVLKLNR